MRLGRCLHLPQAGPPWWPCWQAGMEGANLHRCTPRGVSHKDQLCSPLFYPWRLQAAGQSRARCWQKKELEGFTTVKIINTMSSSRTASNDRAGPPRARPFLRPSQRDRCSSVSVTAGSQRACHGNSHEKGECPGVCHVGLREESRPTPYCSSFGTSTCRRRHPVTGGSREQ